jgi:hypothetical protein
MQIFISSTQPPGNFNAREKALVYIELEAGWVLELVCVLEKMRLSWCCQDLNPRSSYSVY